MESVLLSDRAVRHVPQGMPALCEPPTGEAGVVVLAVVVAWVTGRHPTLLPAWAPWDFSWPAFLSAGFGLLWFVRGLRRYCGER